MKRFLILIVVLVFVSNISFAFNVENVLKENLMKNFAKRGLRDVKISVKVIKQVDNPKGFYFVKVNINDKKRNRQVSQFLISDGKIIIPDIINVKTGTSLIKEMSFKYDTVNIPTKDLTLMYGSKNAKHTIIKISDFQCPFCRKAYKYLEPKIKDRKDIALYMLNFPLPIHKNAMIYSQVFEAGMAMGYNFAGELYSGKFDSKSSDEIIKYFARKTNDAKRFEELVKSKEIINRIERQKKIAEKYGFRATPVLIFDGKKVEGFDKALIDKGLKSFKN
ncbi:DsbA family protein [Deferribacter abyssi]|uniref:DsbA family protein n=1 Tax=Deferribacter abyssi TaxID=213806 RepID=UPI003C1DCA85